MTHTRRHILAAALAAAIAPAAFGAEERRARRILLRSSWQTVNIGDIGHSPGVIQLLTDHLPEVEVRLWPSNIGNGVEEMLRRNFPKLGIVKGAEAIKQAFTECDFLLHGSGPSLVAQAHVAQWKKETNKPYGVYGITLSSVTDEGRAVLNAAKFVYFRDTISLKLAKDAGLTCPIMDFGPDGAFGVKLRNDEAALAFLKANGLVEGKFWCAIPRLRNTPYWKIHGRAMTDADRQKHEVSEKLKEQDHVKVREAIVALVRQTGLKVLVCPEDQSHMAVGKEMLVDPLPADVKAKVVWHEKYWLTDEAISTYTRAMALLSMDMHSPIMAVANGTPAIHCRFAQQTSKGQMWRDIGLGEWLFDLDTETDSAGITRAVLEIARDPAAARAKVAKAMEFVHQRQRETMAVVKKSVEE